MPGALRLLLFFLPPTSSELGGGTGGPAGAWGVGGSIRVGATLRDVEFGVLETLINAGGN